MRASGHDKSGRGLVQDFDIVFRQHLEDKFVTGSACGVTCAFLIFQDSPSDTGSRQDLGKGQRYLLVIEIEAAHATHPIEHILLFEKRQLMTLDELVGLVTRILPRIARFLKIVEERSKSGRKFSRGDSSSPHLDDGNHLVNADRALIGASPASSALPKDFLLNDWTDGDLLRIFENSGAQVEHELFRI